MTAVKEEGYQRRPGWGCAPCVACKGCGNWPSAPQARRDGANDTIARVVVPPNRDMTGNLIEFEPPKKQLTMADLELHFLQSSPRVLLGEEAKRYGDDVEATVDWGDIFDRFQGTFIEPRDFVSWFDVPPEDADRIAALLTSDQVSVDGKPLVSLRRGNAVVNFFAGSNCDAAVTLSNIGSAGNFDDHNREQYQGALFSVAQNVFRRTGVQARQTLGINNDSRPVLIQDDDCAATIVTLGSSTRIAQRIAGDKTFAGQQINLGVATAHSLGMAVMDANRLRIPTEVTVCWSSWGLTEGLGPEKNHKNYLANVPGIDSPRKKGIFGVGDMGDAAARVRSSTSTLEQVRQDYYYNRKDATKIVWSRINGGDLRLAYAMGGLLTEGMRAVAGGSDERDSMIMARASRQSDGHGFHAVFNHLTVPLAQWAKVLVE